MENKLTITEKITSFESACEFLGMEPIVPQVESFPEKDRKSIIAYHKLTIIIRALNEGWEPDWSDWDQYKHYNWFYVERSSAAFRFYATDCTTSHTRVGSRLCFKTRDLAAYAAKTFEDLYKDYFLI
ncbi:MAG: hypothetical protein LBU84_15375 [Prevotella sp.]|jgi:hypothetical protein|nr:hypothetical protein [Prevotella sp.]